MLTSGNHRIHCYSLYPYVGVREEMKNSRGAKVFLVCRKKLYKFWVSPYTLDQRSSEKIHWSSSELGSGHRMAVVSTNEL